MYAFDIWFASLHHDVKTGKLKSFASIGTARRKKKERRTIKKPDSQIDAFLKEP